MIVTSSQHEYKDFIVSGEYKVIDCESCGFWHVYPIPDQKALDKYYQELYYQSEKEHGDMKDKGTDPDGYYRIKYFDKLTNFNNLLLEKKEKSILDLGAGFGDFLAFMKEQTWHVQGAEPSGECLKQSKYHDCNIVQCGLENLNERSFNVPAVITLNTVLEHYPYPKELLMYIKENLMDFDTVLHIEVPNDFSFLQKLMNVVCSPKKHWICPPGHLNYWTHKSLIQFVEKLGFIVEVVESTFPLELMALLGDDYISFPEKGRGMHLKRVAFEKKLFESGQTNLKLELFRKFAQAGMGREILLYLRKS